METNSNWNRFIKSKITKLEYHWNMFTIVDCNGWINNATQIRAFIFEKLKSINENWTEKNEIEISITTDNYISVEIACWFSTKTYS